MWGMIYSKSGLEYGKGRAPFHHFDCPIRNCEIYNDRNDIGILNSSDAVVFHMPEYRPSNGPPFRLQHQKWIFYSLESPRSKAAL